MSRPTTRSGEPATKAAVRDWMKRIRQDLRDLDDAMREDDWEYVYSMAQDASCAAAEIEAIAAARTGSER